MAETPNNKIIEIRSISYLKCCLTNSSKIIPNINENDKTPSWDGNVEIYNNSNMKKEYLDGCVPVQVKGRWRNNLSANTVKYPVSIIDLKNFQKNGGAIFFVIYCNYSDYKIYYASLLPFDIDSLLKTKKSAKTISVELDRFPTNEREIYLIFKDFLYHSKRQLQRDERIQKMFLSGKLDEINPVLSFGYGARPYPDEDDTKEYMLTHPTYIYAKPKGLDIDVVLHKMSIESIDQKIKMPIVIDGQILYDNIVIKTLPKKKHVIYIGKNIKFDMDNSKFHFDMAPDIKTRIKDLKIITAIMEGKSIVENSAPIIAVETDDIKLCNNLNEHLNYLLDVQKVMDLFLVKKNLDLQSMSDEDSKKLAALVRMVLYSEPSNYSFNGKEGVGFLQISNIKLLVSCKKTGNKGMYMISNIFSPNEIGVRINIQDGNSINISPYMHFLKYEQLITVDNIDFHMLVESIKSFARSELYDAAVNLYVLDLLSAYDSTKNSDFLNAANSLILFISSDENATETNAIYKINEFQIRKRMSDLPKDDKIKLMKFKNLYTDNVFMTICINILLESYEEAELLYESLSNEEKRNFDTFPINSLWKEHDT